MTSAEDDILISIRPSFADAIFNGSKTVEVRRRIPAIKPGVRVWIYVTKPVGEVRGVARVTEIVEGDPDEVWRACAPQTGLDRAAFHDYLDGSPKAYGIIIAEVKLGQSISMEALRSIRTGFHPPQVLTRLTATESDIISDLLFPALGDLY